MSLVDRSRSMSRLLGDGVEQLGSLFHVELQLAQAEVSEKVRNASRGIIFLLAAALFAIPVLTLFFAALALWISASWTLSLAASLLIAALIAAMLGIICGLIALNYLRARNLRPGVTLDQIRRDVAVVKEAAQ